MNGVYDLRAKFNNYFFSIACFIVLAIFIYKATIANIDLSAGRFALFMDERLTFDGVKRILHPESVRDFFWAVINGRDHLNGGDHRYGRSLWNSMALFSFFPERFWGDSGQIIAGRMLQVVLIISTCCVFLFGLLRNWLLRLVLLVAVLAMPFSDYYMTMPKPEPLQLLFLAVFCYFFFQKKVEFGWYWIFAGLAFGTKISTLPVLAVFLLVSFAARDKAISIESFRKSLFISTLAFFVGLAIAVPILFLPVLLGIGGYFAFGWLNKKFNLKVVSRAFLAISELLVILLLSRKVLKVWFEWTFLYTTHGFDQDSINALSWLSYLFEKWLIAPEFLGLALVVGILLYLLLLGIRTLRANDISREKTAALAIAIAGIALNTAIFFGTKRLWGFYLYPGMVLMIVGVILLVDLSISESSKAETLLLKNQGNILGYVISILLLGVAGLYWMPKTISGLRERASRTATSEYIQQNSSHQIFVNFLNNYQTVGGKQLRVMINPSLFLPESNSRYQIVEFWGPYIRWDDTPDVIIFGAVNTPKGEPTPKGARSYNAFLMEREGYALHVTEKGASCKGSPCFERELELPNGEEILVLKH